MSHSISKLIEQHYKPLFKLDKCWKHITCKWLGFFSMKGEITINWACWLSAYGLTSTILCKNVASKILVHQHKKQKHRIISKPQVKWACHAVFTLCFFSLNNIYWTMSAKKKKKLNPVYCEWQFIGNIQGLDINNKVMVFFHIVLLSF